MENEAFFADTDERVTRVIAALDRAADRGEPVGFDTEFYGVDLRQKSPVAEARLHLISVAVRRHPAQIHPRGFGIADTAVFLGGVIEHPDFRRWVSGSGLKAVHNLPVDAHTLRNAGVTLNGGVNTLAMARWAWPGRARGAGFTLDSLGRDFCGVGKTEGFDEVFSEEYTEELVRIRKGRGCECGARLETGVAHPRGQGHKRVVLEEREVKHKTLTRPIALQDVVPGHPRWQRALEYSAQDAWLALAVYELAQREMRRQERIVPWYPLQA